MSGIQETTAEDKAAVLDLEARRRRALIDLDMAELESMFHDSLIHIHKTGLTHNKEQLLEHIVKRNSCLDVIRGELDIKVVGNIAVMVGPLTNHMRLPEGDVVLSGVATQILFREFGRWKFISFQITENQPADNAAKPSTPKEKA